MYFQSGQESGFSKSVGYARSQLIRIYRVLGASFMSKQLISQLELPYGNAKYHQNNCKESDFKDP